MTTDTAFREDAPPAAAWARERQLQAYRNLFGGPGRVEESAAIAAIDWVDQLASSGHVGAQRLFERALDCNDLLAALHRRRRPLLERMAGRLPVNPERLAFAIVHSGEPDPAELEALLPTGSPGWALHAAHLQVARAAGIPPRQEDFRALAAVLVAPYVKWGGVPRLLRDDDHLRSTNDLPSLRDTGLLYQMAKWRTSSDDPVLRADGERLAQAAIAEGSRAALGLIWDCEQRRYGAQVGEWPLPPHHEARFTQQWFEQGRPVVPAAMPMCLRIAVTYESRESTREREEAILWYERGMGRSAWREGGGLDPAFCVSLAKLLVNIPELQEAWTRRAREAGDPWSMARWLNEQLGRQGEHAARPSDLRERLTRFLEACTAAPRDRWPLYDAVRAMLAKARSLEAAAPPDLEAAREWRALADLIDPGGLDIPR